MLGDLAVAHSHDVDGFKLDFSTGRRHTQECSLVRSMIRLVSRHKLSIGGLPMDICVKSGNAARSLRYRLRAPSRSGVLFGWGVWSTKSTAKSSSKTSKFPRLCTSSVFRRTTAFAASVDILAPFAMRAPP